MSQNPTFGCGAFLPGEGPGNFSQFVGGGIIETGGGDETTPPDPSIPPDPPIQIKTCVCLPNTSSPISETITFPSPRVALITRVYSQTCTEFPNSDSASIATANALSNLLTDHEGKQVLVDYGDLYGDAIAAIRETGLNIIQVNSNADWKAVTKPIITAFNFSFTDNPKFAAAMRKGDNNIFIRVFGLEIIDTTERYIVIPSQIDPDIIEFLNRSGRYVLTIGGIENLLGSDMG